MNCLLDQNQNRHILAMWALLHRKVIRMAKFQIVDDPDTNKLWLVNMDTHTAEYLDRDLIASLGLAGQEFLSSINRLTCNETVGDSRSDPSDRSYSADSRSDPSERALSFDGRSDPSERALSFDGRSDPSDRMFSFDRRSNQSDRSFSAGPAA
jgi:hypothetical protein